MVITKGEALLLSGRVLSEKNDFLFDAEKTKDALTFFYEGIANFDELSKLFENPLLEGGNLKGKFSLSLNLSKIASLSTFSLSNISEDYRKFSKGETF